MLRDLRTLSAARWQVFWNTFKHSSTGTKVATVLGILLVLLLMVLAFLFAFILGNLPHLLANVSQEDIDKISPTLHVNSLGDLITRIIALVFVAAFLVLLLSGFRSTLNNLYLSSDMEMLLVAPISMSAVFLSKFLRGLLFPYFMLLGFGTPFLFGIGLGLGYGPAYYPVTVLALFVLPLIPAGLSAIATVALVRVLPPGRIRDIMTVVGGLFGVAFYILSQLPNILGARGLRPAGGVITTIGGLDLTFLPPGWGANAMKAAGEGNWAAFTLWGGLFFGISLVFYIFCIVVSERLYYSGWANVNISATKSRAALKADARRGEFSKDGVKGASQIIHEPLQIEREAGIPAGLLGEGAGAVLDKDFNLLRRDPTGLTQLLWPVAVSIVFMLQLVNGTDGYSSFTDSSGRGGGQQLGQVLSSLRFLAPTGIVLFAISGVAAYFGLSAFSRERKGVWMLKLAPVNIWSVLLGKFIVAYIPTAIMALGLSFAYGLVAKFDGFTLAASVSIVLLLSMGLTGICVGLGGISPKFDWDNPQRQNSTAAGCLYFPLFFIYVLLAGGALIGGSLLGSATHNATLFVTGGVLLAVAITVTAIILPFKFAADSFAQLEL